MKNMIKDAAVLFVITVAAGLILGFVYQITKRTHCPCGGKGGK